MAEFVGLMLNRLTDFKTVNATIFHNGKFIWEPILTYLSIGYKFFFKSRNYFIVLLAFSKNKNGLLAREKDSILRNMRIILRNPSEIIISLCEINAKLLDKFRLRLYTSTPCRQIFCSVIYRQKTGFDKKTVSAS